MRRTSVAIHESGVAQRGVLFTCESLESEQEFQGTITAEVPALLDALTGLGPVRVGGRSTTHGLAAVTISKNTGQPPAAECRVDGKQILRLRSPGISPTATAGRAASPAVRNSREGSVSRGGGAALDPLAAGWRVAYREGAAQAVGTGRRGRLGLPHFSRTKGG